MTDSAPRVPVGPPTRCPYCLSEVELVAADIVYPQRPELGDRQIWRCTNCDAHVCCHRAGASVALPDGEVVVSDGALSVWERQVLIADAPREQGAPNVKRIRLNIMVEDPEDPEDAAAVKRASRALYLGEDAVLPY